MKTATTIDHILTNFFVDTNLKSAIFETNISDHFPICLFLPSPRVIRKWNHLIYNRIVDTLEIEMFNKQQLYEINWKEIKTNQNPNEAYNIFIQNVLLLYNRYFPKKEIKVTKKYLQKFTK